MNLADRSLLSQVASGIDNVHLVLRNSVGAVVLDTVVSFPLGQDELTITASVQVRGESEQFAARFELRAGTTTMFEGTQDIVAKAGVNAPAPTTIPLIFVGPGARAARVTVTPGATTLLPGATVSLSATVADSSGAPILGAVIGWSSSNEASATVNATGVVTALNARGTATITARTPNGVSASAIVRVTLPASRVVIAGGDGQTAAVGTSPAQLFAVQVQAVDGVGVGGVTVAFGTSVAGASVSPATATTDSTGRASTIMTLGRTIGTHTFTATSGGLGSVSVTETATRGAATVISIVSGDAQVDTAGRALRQPLVVRVTDANGNVASGVNVTWSRVSGSGTLSAASSSTDTQGQAQATYTLGNTPGTDIVRAAIAALPTSAVDFTTTTKPRAASRVVVVSGSDQTGVVGSASTAPLVVRVLDDAGQPVAGVTLVWNSTNGAVLSANTSTTDSAGTSRNSFTYPTRPGGFVISAQVATLVGPSVGFSLTATIGPPAKVNFITGSGQSGPGGANVGVAPSVVVADLFDNPIAGVAVIFIASSGGSVTGSPATTNLSGVATVGSWKLGATAGTQTLTATVGGVSASISATATAAAPPVLSVVQQPSASVANTQPFAVQPKVQLKTAAGVVLKTAGVAVTVALKTVGPALRGTLTATTDTAGVASFAGLSLKGTTTTSVLTFSASGYAGDTSATFKVVSGPAIGVAASSATSLSGLVNTVASPNPTVFVTDSSGNGVGGANVTFAVADTADGSVLGGAVVTDTSGHASPTSWTIGKSVRADTLSATASGLAGSPVRFIATTTAGTATQLVKIGGDAQTGVTGNPLASPMVVEARDALNNPVSGVTIGFTAFAGGGSPATQSVVTAANGQSSFTLTLGAPGADSVKACLPSCATAQVIFTALAIPVGADAIWTGTTSNAWAAAANWSPAVVPGAANKVFIPAATPNSATLGGNAAVTDLTMANGATLNVGTSQLALSGSLFATGATMTGTTGYVYFCGGGHTFSGGSFTMVVDCGATVTPTGTGAIAGSLNVQGGSVFDVGAAAVTVAGAMNFPSGSGSHLKMTTVGGHLTVAGDAFFSATDMGDGWLTEGILEVKGNFTAQQFGTAFRATINHITRFSGTGAQTIYSQYNGGGQSQFANVEITNTVGVTLASDLVIAGNTSVAAGGVLAGPYTWSIGGLFTALSGSNLSGLAAINVFGGGNTFPLLAGSGPTNVNFVNGAAINAPSGAVTLPTNLVLYGGAQLVIGGSAALTINGNLTYPSGQSSRLSMIAAGGKLTVVGDAFFGAVDMGDGWLTDGVLELKGNFTAQQYGTAFRATGNHITRFSGTGAQTVYSQYNGGGQSQFANVEITNTVGVTLSSDLVIAGNTSVAAGGVLAGPYTWSIGGLFTAQSASNLSGLAAINVFGGGNTFPLLSGAGPTNVNLVNGAVVNAPAASATLPTNLVLYGGAQLVVGANALTINGNLIFASAQSARLKMITAGGHLTVTGDAFFGAVDMGDGWLTDGVLELKGNFTAQQFGTAFRATGNHITRFSGTAAQTVYSQYNGGGQSQFANVEITNTAGVTLGSDVVVAGTTTVGTNGVLAGGFTWSIGGLFTAQSGSNLSGLAQINVFGSGNTFPLLAGTGPTNVNFVGGAVVNAPAGVTSLPTNLVLYGGSQLVIGGSTALTVNGNLTYPSGQSSRLNMTAVGGKLAVTGDALFGAVDMGDGWLTEGVLELKGNFTAQQYGTAFRATGNHITRFSGTGAQTVYSQYNGGGQSQFANVEITNTTGVTLGSDVVIAGTTNLAANGVLSGPYTWSIGGLFTAQTGSNLSSLAQINVFGGGNTFPLLAGTGPTNVNLVNGAAVNAPVGAATLPTNLVLWGGAQLVVGGSAALTINGNLTYPSGQSSRLSMIAAGGKLTVVGDAFFGAVDMGDGWLTEGVLELRGNFTAQQYGTAFRASSNHLTRFSGTTGQTISVQYTGGGQSQFGNVEITNLSGAGVTPLSNVPIAGFLNQLGRLSITSVSVSVGGAVTLGASSITNVAGGFSFPTCSLTAGATKSGFTCPYP